MSQIDGLSNNTIIHGQKCIARDDSDSNDKLHNTLHDHDPVPDTLPPLTMNVVNTQSHRLEELGPHKTVSVSLQPLA